MRKPVLRDVLHDSALLLAALALAATAVNAEPAAQSGKRRTTIAATVDGKPVYRDKLNSPDIAKTRQQLYQLEQAMLRQMVLEKLGREKPGEFAFKDIKISEKEVRQVYLDAGLKDKGSLDAYRERIRAYLVRNKIRELEDALFRKAVSRGYVKSFLTVPPPYMYRLKKVRRPASHGPANAPVQMVEFSDFQCPFCNRVRRTVDALLKKYGKKIHLVYRHLPLTEIHPQAWKAAEYSECAGEQGRFWPYHDLVFDNAGRLNSALLAELGERAGLRSVSRFKACVRNGKYEKRVRRDVAAAGRLGINGTPAFFIGRETGKGDMEGEVLSGAQPLDAFVAMVEKTLKAARK